MDKDNKSTELDNTDKKLHISGVMNSILNDLQEQIKYYEEPPQKILFITILRYI